MLPKGVKRYQKVPWLVSRTQSSTLLLCNMRPHLADQKAAAITPACRALQWTPTQKAIMHRVLPVATSIDTLLGHLSQCAQTHKLHSGHHLTLSTSHTAPASMCSWEIWLLCSRPCRPPMSMTAPCCCTEVTTPVIRSPTPMDSETSWLYLLLFGCSA